MELSWPDLKKRHEELSNQLLSPSLDYAQRQEMQKEHSRLSNLLEKRKVIEAIEADTASAQKEMASTQDAEMKALFLEELNSLEEQLKKEQQSLENILYPPDPLDDRSVFIEIRAGTGGQEAALFAADLMKMYTNYALSKGWQVSLADMSETDLGGIREVTLHIQGDGVFGHLKFEAGVHRVQRVPKTETQGRVHTSTATVAVLPEADEVEFNISPADLRVDTFRAGGAGGQHVNKTESAVRITHIPTGVAVACQEERSQHKNRAKAMKMLQSRLLMAQREKQEMEESHKRKEMVGTGMRAEKVRTYNFPQNRVTDHQVEVTLKKLDRVIEGDLDDIIQPLIAKGLEDRRKALAKAI
ncbi:peptide chain release factor 1 [Candidatus Dependentiae bacterium]|nr:peptide chain release factor 1 [Candidatus Dependentiae bacterium]